MKLVELIKVAEPIIFDKYYENHVTGRFILIDASTNQTLVEGMMGSPTCFYCKFIKHARPEK